MSWHGWLDLNLAWAKQFELSWLGSAWQQTKNPSLIWIRLEGIWNIWAKLGSGWKRSELCKIGSALGLGWISELRLAQAWKKLRVWAWLRLGLYIRFIGTVNGVRSGLLSYGCLWQDHHDEPGTFSELSIGVRWLPRNQLNSTSGE